MELAEFTRHDFTTYVDRLVGDRENKSRQWEEYFFCYEYPNQEVAEAAEKLLLGRGKVFTRQLSQQKAHIKFIDLSDGKKALVITAVGNREPLEILGRPLYGYVSHYGGLRDLYMPDKPVVESARSRGALNAIRSYLVPQPLGNRPSP